MKFIKDTKCFSKNGKKKISIRRKEVYMSKTLVKLPITIILGETCYLTAN